MAGFTVAAVLSALTVALLLVLTVWGHTYRPMRTPLALGLVLFAVVLLAENSVVLYFTSTNRR
jgi:hypothetical protein